MLSVVLSSHSGLAHNSRVYLKAREERGSDVAALGILMGAGVAAAFATVFLDFGLRIPGHAILRAVFPMALGLSLAPRRGGGVVMGLTALGSLPILLLFKTGGSSTVGFGSLTSLALTGPLLDAALWRARTGWWLYFAFAVAGLTSNLIALASRGMPKSAGLDHLAANPFASWWFRAVVTYPLCGILAGLLSAAVWFRFSSDDRDARAREPRA